MPRLLQTAKQDLFLFHGLYNIVCKLVIPGAPSGAQKYLSTLTEVLCWFIWIHCQHFQFSHSVVSDSLWPHGLQHVRFPCLSPAPRDAQIHVHQVSDDIQPSHLLSFPSPPAFNFSQHQGLFQWASSSHQVAKVMEFQLQHQSFQWIFRTDFF